MHRSIPDAVEAIGELAAAHGFHAEATDDPDRFTDPALADFDVLVFVHTSGNVVPERAQRQGLERYLAGGGGFFGIHAASAMAPDVAEDWPWYLDLVGASFKGHTVARLWCDDHIEEARGLVHAGPLAGAPADAERLGPSLAMASWEPAVMAIEEPDSPAARGITDGETRSEEWYGFARNPRPHVHVVATVDESTYDPHLGAMGEDHPVVWWHDFGGGRSVYNALGHSAATWHDAGFLASVVGGIELAAG